MGQDTYKPAPVPGAPAENIAETLARALPAPFVIEGADGRSDDDFGIRRIAVHRDWKIESIDDEALLATPRRIKFSPRFSDADSFIRYVTTHGSADRSALWVNYDPKQDTLIFTGRIDEHQVDSPAWRSHSATFVPEKSVEWLTWAAQNLKAMDQLSFATFIEDNELDITVKEGYPTSLQMHKLATDFKYRAELVAKSAIRLQDGTTKLEYSDQPDAPTQEALRLFEKFCIGIPVFAGKGEPAYRIDARLKFKPPTSGKLAFFYDLVRTDRVFEEAAQELIAKVTAGMQAIPVYMGSGA